MPSGRTVRRSASPYAQRREESRAPYGEEQDDDGWDDGWDDGYYDQESSDYRDTPPQLSSRMNRLSSPSPRHDRRRAASPAPRPPARGRATSPYRRADSAGRQRSPAPASARARAASPSPRVAFGGSLKEQHPDVVRRKTATPRAAADENPEFVDRLTDKNRFTGHHRYRGAGGVGPAGKGSDGLGGANPKTSTRHFSRCFGALFGRMLPLCFLIRFRANVVAGATGDFASVVRRANSPSSAQRKKAQQVRTSAASQLDFQGL